MAEIHVTGLRELQEFLDQVPVKIEKNIMRGALRAGAKIIEQQAKLNAPVGAPSSENRRIYGGYAGALRDSIRVTTNAKAGIVYAHVKAGGKNKKSGADVYYAHMIEFGAVKTTAPYQIASAKRGMLAFLGIWRKYVMHPPLRKMPFLRPALDVQAQNAVIAAAEYVKQRLATKQGLDTSAIMIEGDE